MYIYQHIINTTDIYRTTNLDYFSMFNSGIRTGLSLSGYFLV
jgi:hypothetical protein